MVPKTLAFILLAGVVFLIFIFINNKSNNKSSIQESAYILRSKVLSLHPPNFQARDFVDIPILYINLKESNDRKLWMEDQFQKLGAQNPMRIEAILGSKYLQDPRSEPWIDSAVHSILQNAVFRKEVSAPEIGCLLSHIKAIKLMHSSHHSRLPTLVLEDDADMSCIGFWPDSLSSYAQRLPEDWTFAPVSAACPNDHLLTHDVQNLSHSQWLTAGCWSTAAYMISKQCSEAFHNIFFQNGVLTPQFFYVCMRKQLRFTSDVALFWVLDPSRLFIEKIPRIVQYNIPTSMESTIHSDDTIDHLRHAMKVWNHHIVRNS